MLLQQFKCDETPGRQKVIMLQNHIRSFTPEIWIIDKMDYILTRTRVISEDTTHDNDWLLQDIELATNP